MIWCDRCEIYQDDDKYDILKVEKNKKGKYRPYRDTLDSEMYTYTEVTLRCQICGQTTTTEKDQQYHMSKTDMEKFGYRGANYGS